eukprot:12403899-Alexandrium_andersonii.AAC.1
MPRTQEMRSRTGWFSGSVWAKLRSRESERSLGRPQKRATTELRGSRNSSSQWNQSSSFLGPTTRT